MFLLVFAGLAISVAIAASLALAAFLEVAFTSQAERGRQNEQKPALRETVEQQHSVGCKSKGKAGQNRAAMTAH